MNTQEFVESFIKTFRTKLKKLLLSVSVICITAMLMVYFVIMKVVHFENDNMLLICAVIELATFELSFFISLFLNTKLRFNSVQNLDKQYNINSRYNKLLKEYRKTNDKQAFDQALIELELLIREQ